MQAEINSIRLKTLLQKLSGKIEQNTFDLALKSLPGSWKEIQSSLQKSLWISVATEREILTSVCDEFKAWGLIEETGKTCFQRSYTSILSAHDNKLTLQTLIYNIPALLALYASHFHVLVNLDENKTFNLNLAASKDEEISWLDILFVRGVLKGIFYICEMNPKALRLKFCHLENDDRLTSVIKDENIEWQNNSTTFFIDGSKGDDQLQFKNIYPISSAALDEDYVQQVMDRSAAILKDKKELLTAVEYLNVANDELERKIQANQKELRMARAIQKGIIPQRIPDWRGLQFWIKFYPMTEVSGDYYDYFTMGNQLGVMVGDVSGHGVPAALITAISKLSFTNHKLDSPSDIFRKVNLDLLNFVKGEGYLCSFYMIIDSDYNIKYSSAGATPPFIFRSDSKTIEKLDATGVLLGMFPNAGEHFKDFHTNIQPGDKIILYTDGITEATNLEDEQFGEKRLVEAIEATKDQNIEVTIEHIMKVFRQFTIGVESRDDITLLGMMLNPEVANYDDNFEKAKKEYALNNVSEACSYMKRAVDILPRNTLSLFFLGKYLAKNGKYKDAIIYLGRYTALKSYNADASLIIGYCRYKIKDYKSALNQFRNSLSLRIDNPICIYNFIHTCLKLDMLPEAKVHLKKLKEQWPGKKRTINLEKLIEKKESEKE